MNPGGSGGGPEANGMSTNQFAADSTTGKSTSIVPSVHNNYSPNRVFTNGSNNSPNAAFAGHSGKMKKAAALASSTKPG